MVQTRILPLSDERIDEARDIYNHYVRTSTATFAIEPVTSQAFRAQVRWDEPSPWASWMLLDEADRLRGYCSLGPFHPRGAYRYTGVVAVYLHHQHTGKGLGSRAVNFLQQQALQRDLHTLIALISGDNAASLALFEKLGFAPAGRLIQAGYKFGKYLDMITLQKMLPGGPDVEA
jgi:phosphinothricin acetyltransferase